MIASTFSQSYLALSIPGLEANGIVDNGFLRFFQPVALSSESNSKTLFHTQYIHRLYSDASFAEFDDTPANFTASAYEIDLPPSDAFFDFNEYVLPLDENGEFTFSPNPRTPPLTIDKTAIIEFHLPANKFIPVTGMGHLGSGLIELQSQ